MSAISFKCDLEQHRVIADAARGMGMSPGQFARFASLQCAWLGAILGELADLRKALESAETKIIAQHRADLKQSVEFLVKTQSQNQKRS